LSGPTTGYNFNVVEWKTEMKKILVPTVLQSSATELPYPDNYFDAIFTDPPYYDNVPYSYLSDFFYVWLKRSIGDLYPELFSTPLTPKSKEIVAYSHIEGGYEAGKKFFEDMLKKAFQEIHRVLKPNGIVVIVYTHKSTTGWETLINSLLDSGLVITASWPIDTEMKSRLRAQDSAALASSIYIVCRKLEREELGWFEEVKKEVIKEVERTAEEVWKAEIRGADFFVSCIGPALKVFGRYNKVMTYEGELIRADRILELIRETITDYVIKQIFHNGIAQVLSALTRFYVLWRWAYGSSAINYDDARKLAQGLGIELGKSRNFIRIEKDKVRLLGPTDRKIEEIESQREKDMIDVIHWVLLLWSKNQREELKEVLSTTGYGDKDYFYRTCQAISEVLPPGNDEKRLLEGFLAESKRVMAKLRIETKQRGLFE
jgi:adenine-specific DNA methylase